MLRESESPAESASSHSEDHSAHSVTASEHAPELNSTAKPTSNDVVSDDIVSDDAVVVPNGLWPVFRNSNFLTLWSGQVFSQMADKIYL
ncbi:MAG: arabinose efflux permease, partial [Cyanobacteria bacterium P01_A01_bin.17]